MGELDRIKRQLCNFNYKYLSGENTATVDRQNLRKRTYARHLNKKRCLPVVRCDASPTRVSPRVCEKRRASSCGPKTETCEIPDRVEFIASMEQLLCIVYNLKVAVVNDFVQQRTTPHVNTVKLAEQFCHYLECNAYIGYQTDCCSLPVKFFVYCDPVAGNKHLKNGKELVRQDVVAVDRCNRQHSICALTDCETKYIPDPCGVHQPNVTYLNALNCFEGLLRHAIRLVQKYYC